ncbi:MAG TPA: hypothetical protein VF179_03420 [Thermoanaerobaculia bacterium]|nr:hypothetical protein [Thermoanaerobaculia bacterium]
MSKNIIRVALLLVTASFLGPAVPAEADGPFRFFSLTPCRIVDTRNPNGPTGGPVLANHATRNFPVQGQCGVPTGAKAVALNVTVVGPNSDGYLTLFPAGGSQPIVSNINFVRNEQALANGAIVPLGPSGSPDLAVYSDVPFPPTGQSGQVHVILDVTGYFATVP